MNISLNIPLQEGSFSIWSDKYRVVNPDGSMLDNTLDESFDRVATALSDLEPKSKPIWKKRFRQAFEDGVICGGRIMANAGAMENRGNVSTINCLSGDTPVLTKRGIMSARKCAEQSTVEVLNGNGKWVEVQFKSFGLQETYEGQFKFADRKTLVSVRSTLNHRWILSSGKVVTTEYWLTGETNSRHTILPNVFAPRVKVIKSEFDAGFIHGLILGDGTSREKYEEGYLLNLVGDKVEMVPKVSKILGLEPRYYTISDNNTARYYISDKSIDYKKVPGRDVTPSYLKGFFSGILATDGNVYGNCEGRSTSMYVCGSKSLTHYLAALLPTIGIVPYEPYLEYSKGDSSNYGVRKSDIWRLPIQPGTVDPSLIIRKFHRDGYSITETAQRRAEIWTMMDVLDEPVLEEVFCCEEPETQSFVLGTGLLTGNCVVSENIEDSMDSILKRQYDAGMSLKSGCGIGYEFSTLRPNGAYVTGAGASTSGPIPFMDIYDSLCKTVSSAGGRRGAQMATFDIKHPDVIDVIKAKRERGRLRQFNISLLITQEFIEAVKGNKPWQFEFGGKNYGEPIEARALWDLIMESTYNHWEPGFLMIDRINGYNNNWWCETIRATNPSMPAGTLVHTRNGVFPINQLQGKEFLVRSLDGKWAPANCFLSGRDKPLLRIEFDGNRNVKSTPEHRWPVLNTATGSIEKKFAKDIIPGDLIPLNHNLPLNIQGDQSLTEDEGFLLGVYLGDGTLTGRKKAGQYAMGFSINKKDREVADRLLSIVNSRKVNPSTLCNDHQCESWTIQLTDKSFIEWFITRFNLTPGRGNKEWPQIVWKSNDNFIRGFIDGLISSDGYARQGRFVYTTKDKHIAVNFAKLLGFMGMKAKLIKSTQDINVNGYSYKDYTVYRVDNTGNLNTTRLLNIVPNITCKRRREALERVFNYEVKKGRITDYYNVVKGVTQAKSEDVWDINVYHTEHVFPIAWGFTGNCGEQPLPPNGSCLLGSINLTKFVVHPFTPKAYFDFDKFWLVILIFSRMLDNVVEINNLPLKKQRDEIISKRRHGMGYMGLGSAFNMMGIDYGSAESIALTEKITKYLALASYTAGAGLAKEKGAAPILLGQTDTRNIVKGNRYRELEVQLSEKSSWSNLQLWLKSKYFEGWYADPDAKDVMAELEKYNCRYTHATSIAPTGTISSGIGNNCCIAKGTIVQTTRGDVAIEEVTLADKVKRYDPSTDTFTYDNITFCGLTRPEAEVWEVELQNGYKIKSTPDHKFLVRLGDELMYETLENIVTNGIELYEVVVE